MTDQVAPDVSVSIDLVIPRLRDQIGQLSVDLAIERAAREAQTLEIVQLRGALEIAHAGLGITPPPEPAGS